jgi:Lipopolysaccharide-assembly
MFMLISSAVLVLGGCAYKFGYAQRDIPGGYKQIAVPVFKNETSQASIEGYYTNELIRQFNRSQVAEVVDKSAAPVVIEGNIRKITYTMGGQIDGNKPGNNTELDLPSNTVLTVEYTVFLTVDVLLRRTSDQKVLWQGAVNGERVYTAPQVGRKVVNSVNALYNHSARMEIFEHMAKDMMAEAHDRMTENF